MIGLASMVPYEVTVLMHGHREAMRRKFQRLLAAEEYAICSAKALGVRKVRLYRFDQNEPIRTWRARPPWSKNPRKKKEGAKT